MAMGDIFQIKPSFYGVGIDLIALWRWIRRQRPSVVDKVALRFIELFEQHGVVVTQIPRLLPSIELAQLSSPASLLPALTNDVLNAACALFGVRREWLEGDSEQIYEHRYCYKSPSRFFDELTSIERPAMIAAVRALTSQKQLDLHAPTSQRIELVMVEVAGWLGDEEIESYRPFSDGWEWGYPPCRLQLKAMIREYGSPVPLFQVTQREIDLIYSGGIIPKSLMRSALCTDPSLDDYCMSFEKNVHAREVDELEEAISHQSQWFPR
jgi:hypothetical protein